jgi:antitoxin (DNA-binding transcriptional repressor) of toxin-antitoxin stability system
VKTLAIEDIYADPHKLDSYLESGEPVEISRAGRTVAELAPRKALVVETGGTLKRSPIDLQTRFSKMWGPDAFRSAISVGEEIAELRFERAL